MNKTTLGLAGLAAVTTLSAASIAAPRKVMFEQFTASWCGPCQNVGLALGDLTDNFPNSFQSIQMHIWSSSYGFDATWCESRATFYGVSGIPHVQCDGVISRSGTSGQAADYNAFLGYLNNRLGVPTDVGIELTGEPLSGNNYQITMDISMDAGAPSKTMVMHLGYAVDADSGYPNAAYYYDTHFDHRNTSTITLSGGQSTQLQHTFTLNSTAAANTDHVTFFAFAQEPGSNGSGDNLDVYNMGFLDYTIRQPKTFTIDVNGNGEFSSITEALESDQTINGDTFMVGPGVYNEMISFDGLTCTLMSTDGPEATIIDAGGNGTVMQLMGGGSSTVSGFTLMNGDAASGSAMRINGNPTIDNCIIRDNTASSNYVILSVGNPQISNTVFCNNDPNNIGISWTDAGGNSFEDNCDLEEPCPGDLDSDGVIGVNDVLLLISEWGGPGGDVDGNGTTDVNDVLQLISIYGESC